MDWNAFRNFTHRWHVAINAFHHGPERREHRSWMYEAKDAAGEVHRLPLLFAMEREGRLPAIHQQCSRSESEPIVDNHLTCCLGVRCSECPELLAVDAMEGSPEDKDTAKAWTCVTHIISKGGDPAKEGYILTVDDRMFWERTYANLASSRDE